MLRPRRAAAAAIALATVSIALIFGAADASDERVETPASADAVTAPQTAILAQNVDIGATHACAIVRNGLPVCWGYNGNVQLGVPSGGQYSVAVTVTGGITRATRLALGSTHSCVLLANGDVKCWGNGASGQLGTGRTSGSSVPTDVIALPVTVTAIAAAANANCATIATGGLQCWGQGTSGQLGNGTQTNSPTPTLVTLPLTTFSQLVGYDNTFCAVDASRPGLLCWGAAPPPATGIWNRPTSIAMLSNTLVSGVAIGRQHLCVIVSGAVRCWGNNALGQLGNGGSASSPDATVAVAGLGGPAAGIAAGDNHTCARLTDGRVQCWGDNGFGQLGVGNQKLSRSAVTVASLGGDAAQISASASNTCARFANGRTRCWGRNQLGQTGNGESVNQTVPERIAGIDDAAGPIVSTEFSFCALTRTGGVKCWGGNERGYLGDGTLQFRSQAAPVAALGEVATGLESGMYHTCATTQSQRAWCWGWNLYDTAGVTTGSDISAPLQATLFTGTVAGIGSGYGHTCIVDASGAPNCWGYNFYGQTGVNGTTVVSRPAKLNQLAGPAGKIAAGYMNTCAVIAGTGAVQCWGNNASRLLGTTSAATSSVPITVAGLSGAPQQLVVSNYETACAILGGGVLQCWGSNSFQIFTTTGTVISVPVTVTAVAEPVQSVALGSGFVCATSTSRNLYCWGYNDSGQLGNGSTVLTNTAQRLAVLDGRALQVAAASRTACATTTDGSVYCWGRGENGEAGNATAWKTTPQDVRYVPGYTQFSPRLFAPVIRKDPPPPPCDDLEPNDARLTQVYTVALNTAYTARLCSGDKEDNYRFIKPGAGDLVINFLIGPALRNRMNYYVYPVAPDDATGGIIASCELTGQQFPNAVISVRCPNLGAGRYVLRLYTVPEGYGDPDATYTFSLN